MTDARVSLVVPRLDAKPWGGRKLERYGLDLPEGEKIGEALVTAGEATVTAGDGAGRTLQDLIDEDPAGRLGSQAREAVSGKAIFPLLIKLIDAAENLLIQVHPDDEGARALDRLGKTEAWHILRVEPGGKLYMGLREEVTLDEFMEHAKLLDGTSARDMRAVDAHEGKTVLLPAGTIHALGCGVSVYEIQQPSDVTFRLDDWGRVDVDGNPREMHLVEGEAVSRDDLRPEWIKPIELGNGRTLLTACRYFALEARSIVRGQKIKIADAGSPQVVTVISGAVSLQGGESSLTLTSGSSGIIWPSSSEAILTSLETSVLLRAWVPNLLVDIVQPARLVGATDEELLALGGDTGDLREALDS